MARLDQQASADMLYLASSDKNAFIKGCVKLLSEIPLGDLIARPPRVENFVQAYVLARGLPIVSERRQRGLDWQQEEAIDDLIEMLAERGERFLNNWRPKSLTEAALMMDVANMQEDYCTTTSKIPKAVETYLFQVLQTMKRDMPEAPQASFSAIRIRPVEARPPPPHRG